MNGVFLSNITQQKGYCDSKLQIAFQEEIHYNKVHQSLLDIKIAPSKASQSISMEEGCLF